MRVGKILPSLRDETDAGLGDAERRRAGNLLAIETDVACHDRQQAHEGQDGGGLAHAVAAHQAHHLATPDGKVDAEQHLGLAVARFQAGDGEQRRAHAASPR